MPLLLGFPQMWILWQRQNFSVLYRCPALILSHSPPKGLNLKWLIVAGVQLKNFSKDETSSPAYSGLTEHWIVGFRERWVLIWSPSLKSSKWLWAKGLLKAGEGQSPCIQNISNWETLAWALIKKELNSSCSLKPSHWPELLFTVHSQKNSARLDGINNY